MPTWRLIIEVPAERHKRIIEVSIERQGLGKTIEDLVASGQVVEFAVLGEEA